MLLLVILLSISYPIFAATELQNSTATKMVILNLSLSPENVYYIQNLTLGTPPQPMENVIIDTGLLDFIIGSSLYDSRNSTSFIDTFEKYLTPDLYTINRVFETISGPNWTLPEYTFGYANMPYIGMFSGILGLGYIKQESMKPNYENFPMALKSQGLISKAIFSINGREDDEAQIVFGAVIENAYQGSLVRVPFVKVFTLEQQAKYFYVPSFTVNKITFGNIVISSQKTLYEIHMSGNEFITPEPVYLNIMTLLGQDFIAVREQTYFDLEIVREINISVSIQGIILTFPLLELAGEVLENQGKTYITLKLASYKIGYDAYVGVLPGCLMKYYYTVFDYELNSIYFAKYKLVPKPTKRYISYTEDGDFPVPAVDVPNPQDTYSAIYKDELEIKVTESISFVNNGTFYTNGSDDSSNNIMVPSLCIIFLSLYINFFVV